MKPIAIFGTGAIASPHLIYAALRTQPGTVDGSGDSVNPVAERERRLSGNQTVTVEAIIRIWEQLLGIAPIAENDNFFELGGNSLLLARTVTHLRRSYGVDLTLSRCFAAPTAVELYSIMRTPS